MNVTIRGCEVSRWLIVSVSVVLAIVRPAGGQESRPSSEPSTPEPKLRIELTTQTPVVESGKTPKFTAFLVNDGLKPVAVVLPGDGSESAWRTPFLRWDPIEPRPLGRCGMFSRAKASDVISLEPGMQIALRWISYPSLRAGKNKVSLELENVPDLVTCWPGQPVDPLVEEVTKTPRFVAKSNVVEVVLEGDPYRENGRLAAWLVDDQRRANDFRIGNAPRPRDDYGKLHSIEHTFFCRTRAQADQVIDWAVAKGYRALPVQEGSELNRLVTVKLIKNVPLTMEVMTSETTLMLEESTTYPVMYEGLRCLGVK